MRFKFAKIISFVFINLNILAIYFIWNLLSDKWSYNNYRQLGLSTPKHTESIDGIIQNNITVVIRAFQNYDNDIPNTVRSLVTTYPKIKVLIITDVIPYPPLLINSSNLLFKNVKIINLFPALNNSFLSRTPHYHVTGNYVLFLPDSSRIRSKRTLEKMIQYDNIDQEIVSVTFKATKPVSCLKTQINSKEWVLSFEDTSSDTCNFVKGKHASLFNAEILKRLTDPFMLPFPDAFFIQAASEGIKAHLFQEVPLGNGKDLLVSSQSQRKVSQIDKEHAYNMYKVLGIKKVVRENGLIEWYGCRRDTPRCFGPVIDQVPQYLWEGKWTPPCCLSGLRRTSRHVFQQLESAQARYWLEGESLLGAIRVGDILPWDFNVEIGIYKEDINRCTWLLRAKAKPTMDEQGFVWEKSNEGNFFRVNFSRVNKLHVAIFPFESFNGTMSKDSHKPHTMIEFPEHFLKPMSSIDFVGRSVSAPNNIHDFLELRLGEGAIENPAYQSFSKINFKQFKRNKLSDLNEV